MCTFMGTVLNLFNPNTSEQMHFCSHLIIHNRHHISNHPICWLDPDAQRHSFESHISAEDKDFILPGHSSSISVLKGGGWKPQRFSFWLGLSLPTWLPYMHIICVHARGLMQDPLWHVNSVPGPSTVERTANITVPLPQTDLGCCSCSFLPGP